jgi:hypothetical protein
MHSLTGVRKIAASLDKGLAGSGDRRFMYWSIVLTYLLSVSAIAFNSDSGEAGHADGGR